MDVCTGEFDSMILPHVNTEYSQFFLNEVSALHLDEHVVMVIDGAGWHRSDALKAPANIYLLKLPPYAPGLNPMRLNWNKFLTLLSHDREHGSKVRLGVELGGMTTLDSQTRADLLEIIDRAANKATIITSQLPIEHWNAWVVDATIANAILDRLMQKHHRFTLTGARVRQLTT